MADYINVIKGLTAATITKVQTWMHKIRGYVFNLLSLNEPSKEELFRMALRRRAWGREIYAAGQLYANLPKHNRLIASYAQAKEAPKVAIFLKYLQMYQAIREQMTQKNANEYNDALAQYRDGKVPSQPDEPSSLAALPDPEQLWAALELPGKSQDTVDHPVDQSADQNVDAIDESQGE